MNNAVVQEPDFVLDCRIDSEKKSFTVTALVLLYLIILFGNFLVILVISIDHQLQTPMFFYIGALATVDIVNSSSLIPQMLCALLLKDSLISNAACLTQSTIVGHLQVLICQILGLMACDRYVAVFHSLRYPSIITNKTVFALLLLFNGIRLMCVMPLALLAKEFPFCNTNILPFCFCDYITMVRTACTDDPKCLLTVSALTAIVGAGPLTMILFSYSRIAHTAFKISSAEGKSKLHGTCVMQLMVVGTEFSPLLISYMLPAAGIEFSITDYNTMLIVSNVIPPVLSDPITYSFRNQEIKKMYL